MHHTFDENVVGAYSSHFNPFRNTLSPQINIAELKCFQLKQ